MLAGLIAGMLGLGGGVVIVPALALVFPLLGIPSGVLMHLAIGTSLAVIVPTSMSSSYAHFRRGAVHYRYARIGRTQVDTDYFSHLEPPFGRPRVKSPEYSSTFLPRVTE